MANVKLKGLEKIYDNNYHAVKGVDLLVEDGEFMVLVGPSGSGKSTILRMIAGLEDISSGDVLIDDQVVNKLSPGKRDISMVFQNYGLYPHMSVSKNLSFGLSQSKKLSKTEIAKKVEDSAKFLEIEGILERKPREISGGQKQRVALGRALIRRPKVFLFDEPLSNLDAKLRVSMRQEIKKLHKKLKLEGPSSTMVYVTHDQVEAMTMGDRICVLKDGVIQQVDSPLNLYNFPKNKFVASFIGSPSMNFLKGWIRKIDSDTFGVEVLGTFLKLPRNKFLNISTYLDKEVIVGVRPEDIYITSSKNGDLEGIVEDVDMLGNEEDIYFLVEGVEVVTSSKDVRVYPKDIGKTFTLGVNLDKIHLFSGVDEVSLYKEDINNS